MTLQTSDLAGQNIALHLVAPGLSRNISFGIDILPEAAIGMDMILQKPYLSAVEDDEMIVQVELKDQFGNRVR